MLKAKLEKSSDAKLKGLKMVASCHLFNDNFFYIKEVMQIKKSNKALTVRKIFIKRNVITIGLLITLFLIIAISVATYYGQNVGNFVIGVDDGSAKLIELSETKDFTSPSSRLFADSKKNMIDATYSDIIRDNKLEKILNSDGNYDKEANYYIAYSFYLRNNGKQTVDLNAKMNITDSKKDLYKTTRIMFFTGNNQDGIFAYTDDTIRDTQKDYPECIEYVSNEIVFSLDIRNIKNSDDPLKFTIIMWIEGWDPDNEGKNIVGGNVKYDLTFSITN